jgi:hypothetical protein
MMERIRAIFDLHLYGFAGLGRQSKLKEEDQRRCYLLRFFRENYCYLCSTIIRWETLQKNKIAPACCVPLI